MDALRFWVASTAYTNDVYISTDYITEASNHIRKFRNTARFLLGNLNNFEAGILLRFYLFIFSTHMYSL